MRVITSWPKARWLLRQAALASCLPVRRSTRQAATVVVPISTAMPKPSSASGVKAASAPAVRGSGVSSRSGRATAMPSSAVCRQARRQPASISSFVKKRYSSSSGGQGVSRRTRHLPQRPLPPQGPSVSPRQESSS